MNSRWLPSVNRVNARQLRIGVCRNLCVLLSLWVTAVVADENLTQKIERLNGEFQALSLEFYSHRSNDQHFHRSKIQQLSELKKVVDYLAGDDKSLEAIKQLYLHVELIENNLQQTTVLDFLALLLDYNELNLALRLFEKIRQNADDFQIAGSQFIFARYHAQQLEWERVRQLLENMPGDLPEEDAAYANLLLGIALQRLRQHRSAQQSYERIPQTSSYYRHARLNLAIAQIRQGWLTSARQTIDALLAASKDDNSDDFTNRLYLVLGYALLQKDYYRSAREAFRKISLDSSYLNRALLGIALCVINMGEFEHGLNTLALLKSKKSTELTVDESYLMIPYVYEKLQQEVDVATTYTEAMTHYQNRIHALQKLKQQRVQLSDIRLDHDMKTLGIGDYDFEYGKQFPKLFFQNYQQLVDISAVSKNSPFSKRMQKLLLDYQQMFRQIIDLLVQQRIDHVNSYLSQARYGLAKLYDNSKQEDR